MLFALREAAQYLCLYISFNIRRVFGSNVKTEMATQHLPIRSYICKIIGEQAAPVITLGAPQRHREKTL